MSQGIGSDLSPFPAILVTLLSQNLSQVFCKVIVNAIHRIPGHPGDEIRSIHYPGFGKTGFIQSLPECIYVHEVKIQTLVS